ncbi:MAG: ABC transporter permease subunit [Nitriliruptoraceae bacterium]
MAADVTTSTPAKTSSEAVRGLPRGLPAFRWVVRMRRRALLGWGLAVGVVSAIYVSFYPTMGDAGELESLIEGMPDGLVSALGYDTIGTAAGYLESTVYGLLAPILMLVFALGFAARVLAGEEEDGSLELETAAPISRVRSLSERYLALVVGIVWLGVVTGAVTLGLVPALAMEVGTAELAATTLGLTVFTTALASVTFAVGAATGRRVVALATGAGLAVAGYIANALASLMDDGAWLERLSPFAWYLGNEPLRNGLSLGGMAALLGLTIVCLVAAVVTFDRRDLGV